MTRRRSHICEAKRPLRDLENVFASSSLHASTPANRLAGRRVSTTEIDQSGSNCRIIHRTASSLPDIIHRMESLSHGIFHRTESSIARHQYRTRITAATAQYNSLSSQVHRGIYEVGVAVVTVVAPSSVFSFGSDLFARLLPVNNLICFRCFERFVLTRLCLSALTSSASPPDALQQLWRTRQCLRRA
jgi:hypothetical protein